MQFPVEALFKEPNFRYYFLSTCASTLASWVARFLFGWLAWDLTHSALWVGVASGLMLLPAFLLSPIFGVVADRIDSLRGISLTLQGQLAVVVLASLASAQGWFSLHWLLGLSLATGMIASAHTPLRLSLVPQLVSRQWLPQAIATSAVVFNVSRVLSPVLAGWLVARGSAALAFGAAALLFAVAILLVWRIRDLRAVTRARRGHMLTQLGEGLQVALAEPAIRLALLLTLVNALLCRTLLEMLPALSGKLLDGTAATLALLTSSAGVGSILSGLLMARLRGGEGRMLGMMFLSLVSASLVVLLFYWVAHPWLVAAIVFYLSMAATMAGTCGQAHIQLVVGDEFRGRVMSLWTVLALGAPALGSFALGALAEQLGFVPSALGFALLALAVTLALRVWWQRRAPEVSA